tara:strand:+ start:641 stop:1036 length:396 start_codon:yes stop_codon:yes gene_type:complete
MAVSKINSDSPSEYTIAPSDFIVKLRKNLDGVALAHDDIDNNFEVLRRTLNDLHTVLDAITTGDLSTSTTNNLFVDKVQDGSITGDKLASGITFPPGSISLTDAQKAELKGDPGATPTFSFSNGILTITNA